MNEELQSANEELETSKEELQSINEELQTVNAELNARVEELSRANSDIANLLESTQIATVFLDRNLAIKSFTPAAKDLFHLVESDTGRPISHVRARFQSDTVQEDAGRVLRTLSTIERQVVSSDTGARYIMRMMPYRTVDNVIGGVVVTFVDITRITAAETRIGELTLDLRNRVQSLETLLNLLPVGILIVEDDRTDPVRLNRYGAQLLGENSQGGDGAGLRPSKVALRVFQDERELGPSEQPLHRAAHSGQSVPAFEADVMRADGRRIERHDVGDTDVRRPGQGARRHRRHPRHLRAPGGGGPSAGPALRAAASGQEHHHHHRRAGQPHDEGQQVPGGILSAFLGRLRAMAATHELLSHGNWTGASLRALIEAALQSHLGHDRTTGGPARSRPHLDAKRCVDAGPGVLRACHQRHQVRQPVGRRTGRRRLARRRAARAGQRRDRLDRERRTTRERSHQARLRHQLRHAQHRI